MTIRSVTKLVATLLCLLLPLAASAAGQGHDRYFVEFKQFNPNAAAQIRAAGGTPVHEFSQYGVIAARLPGQALNALSANPNVARIVEDTPRYPMAETTPYGIPMVQADLVSDANAANRRVCIIDSGYYIDHEDLPSTGVNGTNDSGTGDWFEDTCGHGTHVAGTVAAMGGNNKGVVGVLPSIDGGVNLHIIKVFDGESCGWTYSSGLIAALEACRDAGADVVSMSLGGGKPIGPWEERAFDDAYNAGVLSVAAAGNDGSTQKSYPASHDSVISVAAIDENKVVADFSQKNDQVELSAPGVSVLSTVPFHEEVTLTVDGVTYQGNHIENAPRTSGTSGALADGGLCTSSGSWSGAVVLCERGEISFFDKVMNVQDGGGVAAAIYNNEPGNFLGTLGDNTTDIPAISLSQDDGQFLVGNKLGFNGDVVDLIEKPASGYAFFNGTSMATPHVSGVAALVWSHDTSWSNAEIRQALRDSAEDLGPAGYDTAYGYGLVQAKAALDLLGGDGGGGDENSPPNASFSHDCTELSCDFDGSGSSDSDGTIVDYAWDFGDGNSGSGELVSHTYGADGTYTVTLTVTDDEGATDSTSQSVTVSADDGGSDAPISLTATGYKVRGLQKADLEWSGATSTNVDIHRDGSLLTTTANDGFHTDDINNRGGGSYTYQVCEAGTSTCSDSVTVTF